MTSPPLHMRSAGNVQQRQGHEVPAKVRLLGRPELSVECGRGPQGQPGRLPGAGLLKGAGLVNLIRKLPVSAQPFGVAVDAHGRIFVATYDHKVDVFLADGSQLLHSWGSVGEADGQFRPWGITIDAEGQVLVVDQHNSRVQIFTAEGKFVSKFGSPGSGDGQFEDPHGVAVNYSTGEIVVTDSINSDVQIFSGTGEFHKKFSLRAMEDPRGVTVDGAGNIFVGNADPGRVFVFDKEGELLSCIGTDGTGDGQFNRPWGVAVDGNGHLYVVDRNNRVQVFA